MIARRARPPLFASWLLLLGCGRFPVVEKNVCGNAVIESGEDCDIFKPFPGSVCRPPGSEGACHLDCRPGSDGKRLPCFPGWGCDEEGICRAPSGQFALAETVDKGNVESLLSGDFDGDGRAELVNRVQLDELGRAPLEFLRFDAETRLSDSRRFPVPSFAPVVRDLDHDGKDELIFNDGRIGLLHGRADGNLVPDICGTYVLPSAAHVLSVSEGGVQGGVAVAALADVAGEVGFFAPDVPHGELLKLGVVPGHFDDLLLQTVGDADLIEDEEGAPCHEVVYALRGATAFNVLNVCRRVDGEIVWRKGDDFSNTPVALDPPQPITQAPLVADVNGDGHADVLVGTAGQVYWSRGDGRTLARPERFELQALVSLSETHDFSSTLPLAVQDLNGDGLPDFVYPRGIVLALPTAPSLDQRYALVYASTATKPWTDARIGDVYSDGRVELLAASNELLDIELFSNFSWIGFDRLSVPSNGPVQQLVLGDFDHDSFGDFAFIEAAPTAEQGVDLQIAYGKPGALPAPQLISVMRTADELVPIVDEGLGGLAIGSTRGRAGDRAVITLLGGDPDRMPVAPCELNEFDPYMKLDSWIALSFALGGFSRAGHADVLALGRSANGYFDAADYRFWLLRDFDDGTYSPILLDGELDGRLRPAHGRELDSRVQLAALAADFSGSAGSNAEQALFAMPTQDGECALLIVGFQEPKTALFGEGPVIVPEPCTSPQVMAVDADDDGWVDIALLAGSQDGPRSLSLLWNDHGQFSADRRTRLSGEQEAPSVFALLPRSAALPLGIAYVADGKLVLLRATTEPRVFASVPQLDESKLPSATGIAAGDLDGDGVVDLAVAAARNLYVFKAGLNTGLNAGVTEP